MPKGKKGVDQRVKGNAKAASSGRMAELLAGNAAGFVGFEAVSSALSSEKWKEPQETKTGDQDPVNYGAGAEFQVVMKQLGKRDTTTKLKALQEFTSLCQREPLESVQCVLTVWSLMYNKLSLDNDHRVREASHKALKSCAERVKGSLGPHIRGIIGCWVSGMCDPHSPAATAAQTAFAAAFPSNKQRDVYVHGFKSILKHVEDIVLKENADTFSDPKVVPDDERVQRYERAVAMSLYGLSLSLKQLSEGFLEENNEVWIPLLSENKLWKLNKHQNPTVRVATYMLVFTICKCLPGFIRSRAKHFCTLVLGSLGENDPSVVGVVWETGLTIITTVESWSEHINVQKALLPGLWSLLNAGGYGSARVTYKFLLPFLRNLVEQIFATDMNFAKSFLEKLSSGVEGERVRNMRSDCEVVMDTYVDCFLYLLSHLKLSDPERGVFQEDLAKMVIDLIEYAIMRCPPVPLDAVNSAVVRIVSGVLSAQREDVSPPSFWATCFQQRFSVRLAEIVMIHLPSDKEQLQFSRIADLLARFKTDATSCAESMHGVVGTIAIAKPDCGASGQQLAQYLAPVVTSLSAVCFTKLLSSQSLQHCKLLAQALEVCGGQVVSNLAGRMFSNDESVNIGTSEIPISVHCDCLPGERECLTLASQLLATVNIQDLPSEDGLYLECVMEAVVVILCSEALSRPTGLKYVEEIICQFPSLLPLMLLKISKKVKQVDVTTLLTSLQGNLMALMSEGTSRKIPYLWLFVSFFLRELAADGLSGGPVVGNVFCKLCLLIKESLNQLEKSQLEDLFEAVGSVNALVIQNSQDVRSGLDDLLVCLLHWSVNVLSSSETGQRSELFRPVVVCFRHLLTVHISPSMWLKKASEIIISKGTTDIEKVLLEAVAFFVLHCEQLKTSDIFQSAYSGIVASLQSTKVEALPLLALELFCTSGMLYMPSPPSDDLLTALVMDTLPPPLVSVVWPAIALSDASILEGMVSKEPAFAKVKDGSHWFVEVDPSALLYGEVEDRGAMTMWTDLVVLFVQGLGYLQSSHMKEQRDMGHELFVRSIIESALERTLRLGVKHKPWIRCLLVTILSRKSSERLLLLHLLFAEFERVLGSEDHTMESCDLRLESISMPELISIAISDSDGSLLVAALGGLCDPALYTSELLHIVQAQPDDLPLVVGCLTLNPKAELFQQAALLILKGLAANHSRSDSSLFESVEESSSNFLSLLTLVLMRVVLQIELMPNEAWDFVLCTLVSLCQLLMESMGRDPTVNLVVFQCVVMELCCMASHYFHSTSPRLDLHMEWKEFFQPALQDCLLPHFLKCAVSLPGKDYGLMHQRYSLSRAVVALCEKTENLSLDELVQIILSNFYPFQSAACILAKRLLSAAEINLSDEENVSSSGRLSLNVAFFKSVLGVALENIDMDCVFLEVSHTTPSSKAGTTSYLFLWFLILQAMGRCSPEARAVVSEWLKDLTLFDHLMHGLFSFLSDSTAVSMKDEMIEVSLSPSMETLACCVYVAVAKQLPFMLRQWHNSLDRQTSAMVSRFTSRIVSPALQQTELQRKYNSVDGNMETRVCAGASEVSVTYRVDECCIELWISLPESYPLQPPSIREGKRVRIDPAQWRKWMLQLNVFVANQNGSLWDGLALWKTNLDKHFAGVEDCMICFSVIHASNYSLPKMSCKTCKKRFHNACLYKWFSTSTKSSCPLCRNVF